MGTLARKTIIHGHGSPDPARSLSICQCWVYAFFERQKSSQMTNMWGYKTAGLGDVCLGVQFQGKQAGIEMGIRRLLEAGGLIFSADRLFPLC